MRPLMAGMPSAETDCIPAGANLNPAAGFELAKGESYTQNGSSAFLPQESCWDPPHPWHLKSSAWDYSVSEQGNEWGDTHDDGFVLGGMAGTIQRGLFSHFLSTGFSTAAALSGINNNNSNNRMIGSPSSPSEPKLKLPKGWLEQISEASMVDRECRDGEEQKGGDGEETGNCGMMKNDSSVRDATVMGLRLGRTFYEDGAEGGLGSRARATSSSELSGVSAPMKKQRTCGPGVRCQVDGCKADLSDCKDYHRRHKVCEMHSKAPKVIWKGKEHRFCQQCSRFHELKEFDESKRSCRKRLADHNERRRKPVHDTSPMVAATAPVNQDRRSALAGIRPYFLQHPVLSATSMLDGSESRRGWPRYDNRVGDDAHNLACRMQVLNNNGGGAGALSSPSSPILPPPHHVATTADRLLMILQAPNKPSSTREMLHHHHHSSPGGQGLTLPSSAGPGLLCTAPGISADCGRALSLLSSQSLPMTSSGQNHEFVSSHTCGASAAASAQSGFSVGSGRGDKLFGPSLTEMDHYHAHHHRCHHHHSNNKEQEEDGSLMSGLGDPMLAQLLHGQDFRSLDTQQVRRTLDLMHLPASHAHQMGMRDGNGGAAAFAELQSLRPYETSIFEHHQQLI